MDNPVGFIESVKWTFASSMPHIPHWYIVRDKLVDTVPFFELARHIRIYGRLGIWGKNYLHWYWRPKNHGFYYWTMGWPIDECEIINRAKVETDTVRYLDELRRLNLQEREVIDKWADWTECPHCGSHDPFAQQWADDVLIGLFCSACRQRFL